MAQVLDLFEYPTDAAAQAAYVSSDALQTLISQTSANSVGKIGDTDGIEYRYAQSFTLSAQQTIHGLSILFGATYNSPTGNVTFRIETDSSGLPSGTLAHANLTKAISPVASNWNEVIFASVASLPAGTYWIVSVCDNQATENCWMWQYQNTNVYANGNSTYSTDGGSSWQAPSTNDMAFKVYTIILQCYSESTIKQQGSYSLKGIAAITDSLNKTLTRTVDPPIDLTGQTQIKYWVRALRTGSNFKIGWRDSGGTTTEHTPNIIQSNTWEEQIVDISAVSNANKDAIDRVIFTVLNADAANIVYLDNMYAGETLTLNMTLISNAYTAVATPTKSRIVLFEEDVDSVTINTDLKAYISRDGGATYTQHTLVDEGFYGTGQRILSSDAIDISGQPSGTSMKWKIETLNNKDLKLHAIGASWN